MKPYFLKTPASLKRLFPNLTWSLPAEGKSVYLTFDDGPVPEVTPWVLDTLGEYKAQATFFCIGKNIQKNPALYQRILAEGHRTGNHTFHHKNAWKTAFTEYIEDVHLTGALMGKQDKKYKGSEKTALQRKLFRPPYGKMTYTASAAIRDAGYSIIMWDVLSADFDEKISPEVCYSNCVNNIEAGSIVIFHDSVKAYPRLKHALPGVLKFLSEEGYQFKTC